MNKDLVAKIREEASAITGQDRGAQVTYANNKEFKWAHAVVMEALRLHPSIPKVSTFFPSASQESIFFFSYGICGLIFCWWCDITEYQICPQSRQNSGWSGD